MATNDARKDPYKSFNFRMAAAAVAVAGIAAVVVVGALSARRPDPRATRRNSYLRLFG